LGHEIYTICGQKAYLNLQEHSKLAKKKQILQDFTKVKVDLNFSSFSDGLATKN
jgi:hypothetical protein